MTLVPYHLASQQSHLDKLSGFLIFFTFLPIINISLGKPVVSFGPGFRIVSLSYRLQYCHHFIKNQLIVDPPHYTPRGKKDFFDNFEGEILELKKKRLR